MSGAQGSAAEGRVVFISHTTRDDAFVAKLRARLETRGYTVLEDSQFLAGEELPAQVKESIDRAATVIAVGSKRAAGSAWVRRELRYARRGDRPKRTIPLIFDDGSTADLRTILGLPQPRTPEDDLDEWPADLIGIRVPDGAGALDALLPGLLDALEGRAGGGKIDIGESRPTSPLADLVLRLRATRFELVDGNRRPVATASLAFYPPGAAEPAAESPEFPFAAPLGKIEAGDLRFYLERYFLTPFGGFAKRARHIEAQLPEWGQDLWDALRAEEDDRADAVRAWQGLAATAQRRFTVQAPPQTKLRRTASEEDKAAQREAQEASTEILALPWELLHDGHGYLFHDGIGARVRRSLPGGVAPAKLDEAARKPPLRVLAVCARPEKLIEMEDGKEHKSDVGYIDHRISIRPLTEALNALGDLADYTILSPPTFPALCDALKSALEAGRPYHIVHFDGHGVFNRSTGLGALVFEHPDDAKTGKLRKRNAVIVSADKLGERLRNAGVGLFFLEACQSAQSIRSPEASVAGSLLQSGIGSVAAMSHSVLVETAKQFTAVFYPALAAGARVGAAMLKGQIALERERQRGWGWEPRDGEPGKIDRRPLELQDWFVPVLYQDGEDPVLLADVPGERVRRELEKDRALALGKLPSPPQHAFVGRSRELLAAERLLVEASKGYVVLRGEGGEGKTTLAVELARWLVATRRFARAAFASAEHLPAEENAARAVLVAWGTQLDPNFAGKADTLEHAEAALAAALEQQPTVLVLDNLETILPPPEGSEAAGARDFDQARLDAVLAACAHLLERAPRARIVLTSREILPTASPFGDSGHVLEVGRLGKDEGMELVARVLAQNAAQSGGGAVHAEALQAEREEEIAALVTTVNGHARSLVLLTPELARRGLKATTAELAEIMADLELRYPGERERSLFASVELSLRRLPSEVREKLAPLGVFAGGGYVQACANVCQIAVATHDDLLAVAAPLVGVGLAELIPFSVPYLRFDPALAPALLRELRESGGEAEAAARRRWAEAYRELAGFLYERRYQQAHLAAHLTRLELPNLLGALRHLHATCDAQAADAVSDASTPEASAPEAVIDFATNVEALLAEADRREALAEVSDIRARAAQLHEQACGDTPTQSAFLAADAGIDRLLESGRFGEAVDAAEALAERTECLADDAYHGAAYDRAMAQFSLGRALQMSEAPKSALSHLATARERFESLAASGSEYAARMVSACVVDEADCLMKLGQLDTAAAKYEEAIERLNKRGDLRAVATGTFQLATLRLRQGRYVTALHAYAEARRLFEGVNELKSVAKVWHQVGIVHQSAGQFEEAEGAYQRSLAMKMQAGDTRGEAASRSQLGTLYAAMSGRGEEAVLYFRQAAEIYAQPETADAMKEGVARSNAADSLVALRRFDQARAELARAFECKSRFGINAEPWHTWKTLQDLERATSNPAAAKQARGNAIAAYAAARRAGWEITQGVVAQLSGEILLIAVAKDPATPPNALPPEVRAQLPQLEAQLRQQLAAWSSAADTRADLSALARPLLAILDGSRDPALAEGPTLHYADAVELTLLLEQLGTP
ncbi:MAG: CHAT domain-containing protein [Planctomycetaceae bacterium]|nr:CHAT domain-containing protein [Planctomycetaceae bacterium]